MIYSGKSAVVLGLGGSGEAAAILLREEGATVCVCESRDNAALREKAARLKTLDIKVLLGAAADSDPSPYDICVLSPGIDPEVPLVQNVVRKKIPIIGELELAFEECVCPVAAITGTNGKTTTTEITTAMLQGSGLRTIACGNIGLPFASAVRQSQELDVVVLEVSSFQLETVKAFRPSVAAWLNLSPNHLDRYRNVEEYRAAKLRIFENQTSEDFAVVNARESLPPLAARKITFSAFTPEADFTLKGSVIYYQGNPILDQKKTRLTGIHNAENLMAALGIGLALGVDFDRMTSAISEYTAPEHRCEFVTKINGVRWVNDSKATNLDAVEKAISSVEGPLILIAGGKDKGFEYDPIAPLIRDRVRAAVLIGEMKDRIARSWKGVDCRIAQSLEEAVQMAHEIALPGETVLFSPGTSSFDMFRDYTERGRRFKELVNTLTSNTATENAT